MVKLEFEVIDGPLQESIKAAIEKIDDLTIPFTLMTQSWFKSNLAIFSLSGPGKYEDLSPDYKKQKQKSVGFVYPILKRKGKLMESVTKPDSPNAVKYIINKKTLILGSNVSYGIYHQSSKPRSKIPFRPYVLLGAEQTAPPEVNRRRELWIKMLNEYVLKAAKGE